MRDILVSTLFAGVIVGGVIWSLGLPTVLVSYRTGECVKVVPEGSCKRLPSRYYHQWVN